MPGRFLTVAFICQSIIACDPAAPVGSDDISTRQMSIVNGVEEHGYAAVGVLLAGSKGACSATLISPRTVLTAAHCVKDRWPVSFLVDGLDGARYPAASISIHPRYAGGDKADLAVVRLAQSVVGVKPLVLAKQPPLEGEQVLLLGYGKTGENEGSFGTKRAAATTVTQLAAEYYIIAGATNVCDGDSGGPTLAKRDGEQVLIGVHSTKGDAPCGVEGHDMRVDHFRDWILQESEDVADQAAPEVEVLTPADGARVDGEFTVVAAARDDVVIRRVVLLVDGQVAESRRQGPYEFSVSGLTEGTHTIEVVAHDQRSSQTATVVVEVTDHSDHPLGHACATADQCQSRICTAGNGLVESFCSRACFADAPCGKGFKCDEGLCRLDADLIDSEVAGEAELGDEVAIAQGCSVGGRPASLPLLPLLLLALLVIRRKR